MNQELLRTPTQDGELSVVVSRELPEEDMQPLWEMIESGFAALNSRSYDKQSMAFDEFLHDVESPDVLKYVAYNQEKVPVGFLTVHAGLEGVDWVDKEMVMNEQAEVDPTAASYYIGTLVVTPDVRGTETAPSLVRAALRHFRDTNEETGQDSLCFFDCAKANHPWLARFVRGMARPTADFEGIPIKIKEIGTEYWAEDLTDEDLANTGHVIKKVRTLPDDSAHYNVVDEQHFYSIQVKKAA
jgi:hypothetical protein